MKIVNILGGLGNQMFEYAMLMALRVAHPNEEVRCCTRCYKGYGLHNGYELNRIFGVNEIEASLFQLAKLAYPFFDYRTWQIMRHVLPVRRKTMTRGAINIPFDYSQVTREDSAYYDGYWQNEGFFEPIRDRILDVFSFPVFSDERNVHLTELIKDKISVSCHVRRGDYLKDPSMCVCTPEYYAHAITIMNNQVDPAVYCIFSDDIPWCKENMKDLFRDNTKVVFVDWNSGTDSYRDMQLMSMCTHSIVANSSFSWWGDWSGDANGRIVIAPQRWSNGVILNDPTCKDWIKVE